jgi:hypothetical protein
MPNATGVSAGFKRGNALQEQTEETELQAGKTERGGKRIASQACDAKKIVPHISPSF